MLYTQFPLPILDNNHLIQEIVVRLYQQAIDDIDHVIHSNWWKDPFLQDTGLFFVQWLLPNTIKPNYNVKQIYIPSRFPTMSNFEWQLRDCGDKDSLWYFYTVDNSGYVMQPSIAEYTRAVRVFMETHHQHCSKGAIHGDVSGYEWQYKELCKLIRVAAYSIWFHTGLIQSNRVPDDVTVVDKSIADLFTMDDDKYDVILSNEFPSALKLTEWYRELTNLLNAIKYPRWQ